MLLKNRYSKSKRLKYFIKNKVLVEGSLQGINQVLKLVDIKKAINKFYSLLSGLNKNKAAIKIQKVYRGYKVRKMFKKYFGKADDSDSDFDDFDTGFFDQEIDIPDFNDFNVGEGMRMEEYLIRPEVFAMLKQN